MLVDVTMPANTEVFFNFIFDVVSFDLIDTEPLYDKLFNHVHNPLNVKFAALGYASSYLAPNLGFLYLYTFLLLPNFLLICFLIYKCTESCQNNFFSQKLKQVLDEFFWNDFISFIDAN